MKSYTIKENHIGLDVSEILPYTNAHKHGHEDILLLFPHRDLFTYIRTTNFTAYWQIYTIYRAASLGIIYDMV